MRLRILFHRFVLVVGLFAAALGGLGRGGAASGSPEARALRRAFPIEAVPVLQASRAFVATAEGFGVRLEQDEAGPVTREAPETRLPRRGDGAIRFALGGGLEVRVHEVGATGEGALAERAVAYARAGGTSYWAATEEGVEEWLLLSANAVRRDAAVAGWEVEGAELRQAGEAVELVDGQGVARMRVTAPDAYAAGGRKVGTRLRVEGARLALWVDAEGEAVLVDPGWSPAGEMSTGRSQHTATRLSNGNVLVVGGVDDGSGASLSSAEIYDPHPLINTFEPAGTMSSARSGHTATLLQTGRVLVVGGGDQGNALASAEVYVPESNSFTPAGTLSTPRLSHTATLLPGGRVLVVGGWSDHDQGNALASAEVYVPESDSFTLAGTLGTPRVQHTATLLQDGRVLVVGGDAGGTAELYHPESDSFTPAGTLSTPRSLHTATLLQDGGVLVVGGTNLTKLTSAEVYRPGSGWKKTAGSLSTLRIHPTTTLLPDGRVLIVGGDLGGTAEVYDPESDSFTPAGSPSTTRLRPTATSLLDGRVLVVGGESIQGNAPAGAEVYDPKSDSFTPAGSLSTARVRHTATLLPNGSVLVVGGSNDRSKALTSAEMFDPGSGWTTAGSLSTARTGHTATLLPTGQVLVVGGRDDHEGPSLGADIYDAGHWTITGPVNTARSGHTATLLPDGRVLIVDGGAVDLSEPHLPASAEVYDPEIDRFTLTRGSPSAARYFHTATLLPDGLVLVVGGDAGGTAELYDPQSDGFTPAGLPSTARFAHTATLLPNGKVLVVGGKGNQGNALASAEIYDPKSDRFTPAGSLTDARFAHTATSLPDGRVLVVGGESIQGNALAGAEVYDPKSDSFTPDGSMRTARAGHTATLLPNGPVLVAGGQSETPLAGSELFQLQPQGAECRASAECQSYSCVDGVCCGTACDAPGSCSACSRALGATQDGTCTPARDCHGFVCDRSPGALVCKSSCAKATDCGPGYTCEPPSCVPLPPRRLSDCSLAPPAAPRSPPPAYLEVGVLLLAALTSLRRRAR